MNNIQPLLGRKACMGMKIISYLDNNDIYKSNTKDTTVFTLEIQSYTLKQQLIEQPPNVVGQGVGKLEGNYCIRLNKDTTPTQHSPWRIPVALQDHLKETLDSLVTQNIIMPVPQSKPWINSIVVVPKKDGTYTENLP